MSVRSALAQVGIRSDTSSHPLENSDTHVFRESFIAKGSGKKNANISTEMHK